MQNVVSRTVLSQYANSEKLLALIEGMNDAIDPSVLIDQWYQAVWNIDTAQGYGLDVWGRIVGIGRLLRIPIDIQYFGFQAGADPEPYLPFNVGTFYNGEPATSNYELSDDAYRSLIFFKAFANICDGTIPSLNRLVNKLFQGISGLYVTRGYVIDGYFSGGGESGRAYVEDMGGMQMRYVFDYDLNIYQRAIINTPGLLPHPAGVKVFVQT